MRTSLLKPGSTFGRPDGGRVCPGRPAKGVRACQQQVLNIRFQGRHRFDFEAVPPAFGCGLDGVWLLGSNVANLIAAEPPRKPSSSSDDVAACVEHQERLEKLVPRCIYAAVIGVPFLLNWLEDGTITFMALLGAGFCFLAAKLVVWIVRQVILFPLHTARYDRATAKLKSRLQQSANVSAGPFS